MKFPGFITLLKQVWFFYKTHFLNLFKAILLFALCSLVIIPILIGLAIIVAVPAIVFKNMILTGVLVVMAIIFGIVIYTLFTAWIMGAVYWAVRSIDTTGKFGVKEAFSQTKPKVLKLWWAGLLTTLIIIAGYSLVVFFIIPGIIVGILFSVWFSLTAFMVLFENSSGIEALSKSKAFIKGHALRIFLYYLGFQFVLWLILYIPTYVFQQIDLNWMASLYSFAYQLLIVPVSLVFSYLIYKNLKAEKGEVTVKPKKGWYITGAVVGFIVPFLFIGMIGWAGLQLMNTFSSWDNQNINPYDYMEQQEEIDNYTGSEVEYF